MITVFFVIYVNLQLHKDPENKEALEKLTHIEPTKQYVQQGLSLVARGDLSEAEKFLTVAVEVLQYILSTKKLLYFISVKVINFSGLSVGFQIA